MSQWEMKSAGISSKDVYALKNAKANPQAFQGVTWHFAGQGGQSIKTATPGVDARPRQFSSLREADALHAKLEIERKAKAAEDAKAAKGKAKDPPKDPVGDEKAATAPVEPPPAPKAPAATAKPTAAMGLPTKAELSKMTDDQLQKMAAAIGIADVSKPRDKLIDEICAKK